MNSLTFASTPNSKGFPATSCTSYRRHLLVTKMCSRSPTVSTAYTEIVSAFNAQVHLIMSFSGHLVHYFLLHSTNSKHEQHDGEHSDSPHTVSSHLLTCIVRLQLGQRVDGDFAQRAVQQLLRLLLLRLRRREGSVVGGGLGRGGGRSRMRRRRQSRGQGGGDRGRGRR